jgi:SAM-dependent methyltransferase
VYGYVGSFSNIYRFTHRLRIETIFEILCKELAPQKLLLDAGCWFGAYSILLSRYVRVIGIDVSRISIRKAKKWRDQEGKRLAIDFIVCDIEHLPFRQSIFDFFICSETLEHLKHVRRGLTELVRALKNGGKGLVSMPNCFSLYYIFQRFFPVVTPKSDNPHLRFDFVAIRKMVLDAELNHSDKIHSDRPLYSNSSFLRNRGEDDDTYRKGVKQNPLTKSGRLIHLESTKTIAP